MIHCLSLFALSAALSGCAGVNTSSGSRAHAGRELGPPRGYHSVIIEPVILEQAAAAQLRPAERIELSETLGRRAREAFSARYAIVTEPAPDVLRLRAGVHEINRSSRVANLLTAAVLFVPLDMGGVAAELVVEDSVTGDRVASVAGRRQGSPLGRGGFFASFKPTGHAQAGFDQLLQDMLGLLSEPASAAAAKQTRPPSSPPPRP